MNGKQALTYLRLIIAITAFVYILYLGLSVEEFNLPLMVTLLTCLIPDLTKAFKLVADPKRT